MHEATVFAEPEVVALLLDRGADIEARDKLGNTSLHEATSFTDSPFTSNWTGQRTESLRYVSESNK